MKDSSNVILFEKRKPNTDPALYAMKIKKQIDRLIKKGVKAENITVVGTSQGGYIAQYVSFYQKNPGLRFVFVGASFKDDSLEKDPNFRLYGKILSITEKSDDGHVPLSQEQRFIRSNIKDFKEIELNTGLKHGFLFKALDAWIVPTKEWIYSKLLLVSWLMNLSGIEPLVEDMQKRHRPIQKLRKSNHFSHVCDK